VNARWEKKGKNLLNVHLDWSCFFFSFSFFFFGFAEQQSPGIVVRSLEMSFQGVGKIENVLTNGADPLLCEQKKKKKNKEPLDLFSFFFGWLVLTRLSSAVISFFESPSSKDFPFVYRSVVVC